MTDYLIKTDGTSSGLTLGSAIADTDAFEVQQAFIAPASTLHQTFAAIKTWIKAWIVKADVGLGNVANSLQLVAASNLSDLADADAARINLSVGYGFPRNRFYAFTDCVSTNPDNYHWIAQVGGAGAVIDGVAVGTLNAFGINTLGMGTTTTGRASISGFSSGQPNTLLLGLGRCRFQAKAAINVLSNGTETFTTRMGLIDSVSGEPTDGCYFRYTHSVNTGKWEAVTRSNGTETATDTGVTVVADAWKRFEVDVNAAGTSVAFKIDGATVATNTTNIPTGAGRYTSYGAAAIKSAGTTAMSGLYIDFMEIEHLFTTAR